MLDFDEIRSLSMTNKCFMQSISGLAYNPSNDKEHRFTKEMNGYAWSSLLDKLSDEYGIHTNFNRCSHPAPSLRKFVSSCMTQLLSNDMPEARSETNGQPTSTRDRLDVITKCIVGKEFTTPQLSDCSEMVRKQYLAWRRTVVVFRLLHELEVLKRNEPVDQKLPHLKTRVYVKAYENDYNFTDGVLAYVKLCETNAVCIADYIFDKLCSKYHQSTQCLGSKLLRHYYFPVDGSVYAQWFKSPHNYGEYVHAYVAPNEDYISTWSSKNVPIRHDVNSVDFINESCEDGSANCKICIKFCEQTSKGKLFLLWTPFKKLNIIAAQGIPTDHYTNDSTGFCKKNQVSKFYFNKRHNRVIDCNFYIQIVQPNFELNRVTNFWFQSKETHGMVFGEFTEPWFLVPHTTENRIDVVYPHEFLYKTSRSTYWMRGNTLPRITRIHKNQMFCCITYTRYNDMEDSTRFDNIVYNVALFHKSTLLRRMTITITLRSLQDECYITTLLPNPRFSVCDFNGDFLSIHDYSKKCGIVLDLKKCRLDKHYNFCEYQEPNELLSIVVDYSASLTPLEQIFSLPINRR